MTQRGTKRHRPEPALDGLCSKVPKRFIDGLRESGISMNNSHGLVSAAVNIPTGSPQWRKLLSLLAELPKPTGVDINLNFTGPDPVYDPPRDQRSKRNYAWELLQYLPKLNPDDHWSDDGFVHGDARSIVEAAVGMVEDAPEECPRAREVPEGHYMLTLDLTFRNLLLHVTVFRKNSGALAVHPPIEDREPTHT